MVGLSKPLPPGVLEMFPLILGSHGSQDPDARFSHLEKLLLSVRAAAERGESSEALRFADAAHRIAPEDPTAALLKARLLLDCESYDACLGALEGLLLPSALATRAEALCQLGRFEEARNQVLELLGGYAVDCVEGLARCLNLVCRRDPARFAGWVAVDSTLCAVGIARRGSHLTWTQQELQSEHKVLALGQEKFGIFRLPLHTPILSPLMVNCSGGALLGSPIRVPAEFGYAGWVVRDVTELRGEVFPAWTPGRPVSIVISAGESHIQEVVLPPRSPGIQKIPFTLPLIDHSFATWQVRVRLPDDRLISLIGSPATPLEPLSVQPSQSLVRVAPARTPDRIAAHSELVDIVVPVFAGREETLECLASILSTVSREQAEIVVVNDASPDSELCAALDGLAKAGRITLLKNSTNLGFPISANRGMRLHPDRDVVLLNADCEVYSDWLARLRAAAYSSDATASVTAIGDQASIASYPSASGAFSSRESARELDSIAREVNSGRLIESPVGVGFCMYVKRFCLNDIGYFDEVNFGRGYGEECDFCLRAAEHGWRHMIAPNVFVRHRGGRSFGHLKGMLLARHNQVLNLRHPGYDKLVTDYFNEDRLHEARRAIDIERMLKRAKNAVLLVTHDVGGGVQRFVDTRSEELAREGHGVVTMSPAGNEAGLVMLQFKDDQLDNLRFDIPSESSVLNSLLRRLQLNWIELHHFLHVPDVVIEGVIALGIDYRVYLHDYSWVCPRLMLLGGDGSYCGEPEISVCESCIVTHGSAFPKSLSVAGLRNRSTRILDGAEAIFCATDDVRKRFRRYFPLPAISIVPWQSLAPPLNRPLPAARERVRVAVIGAIGVQKGHRIVVDCARQAAELNLPVEFVLIGYSSNDSALLETGRVFITGPYQDNEVPALLEREKCEVALFASVWPETWCLALDHALRDGMPVVAFDIGAFSERLRGMKLARLLPLGTSTGEIIEVLLSVANAARDQATASEVGDASVGDISWNTNKNEPAGSSQNVGKGPEPGGERATAGSSASVQMLTLPPGIYSFSIQSGAPRGAYGEQMMLPAVTLGVAPVQPGGNVDFFAGRGTLDRWLAFEGDRVVIRVTGDDAGILVTSLRRPDDPMLSIGARRIDAPLGAGPDGRVPAQIMAHVRKLGDVYFPAREMLLLGSEFWIEAFVVSEVDARGAEFFEYRGITADGYETPWLSDSVLCGSRGRGTPLLGFAVRPRVAFAQTHRCQYRGHFSSGRQLGPLDDGSLCRSDLKDDPLEGIELLVTVRE